MLVERFREHLTEFLNTVEPADAAHLRDDLATLRKVSDQFHQELIDAILVEAYRSEEIGKIATITGYTPRYIETRIRVRHPGLLDPELSRRTTARQNTRRRQQKESRTAHLKNSRPSREHLLLEGKPFWLMDPVRPPTRLYAQKVHRKVKNPKATSNPSNIKWEIQLIEVR